MKVLHITARADHGGGPEHIFQLLKHSANGTVFYVASPDDAPYSQRYQQQTGGNWFPLPNRRFSLPTLVGLASWARNQGIELVHSHGKGAGLYGRMLKALLGIPAVHTFHGLNQDNYSDTRWRLYLALERALCRITDGLIAVSKSDAEQVYAHNLATPDKVCVIANGVEIPPRCNAALPKEDSPVVIAVTRLERQKDPARLVEIAECLRQYRADKFKLWIVGDGSLLQHSRQLAANRGLDDVISFKGAVDDVRSLLREADVFLSASLWEGLPLAPLEAMSEGLPCVLSDVPGHCDLPRPEQWGFLFPQHQPKQAAARLQQLLSESQEHKRIAESAYEFVRKHYNIKIMAQDTMRLYEDISGKDRRS